MDVEKDLLIVDEVGVSSQQAGREQTFAQPVFSDPERVYCRVADPGQERLRRSEGSGGYSYADAVRLQKSVIQNSPAVLEFLEEHGNILSDVQKNVNSIVCSDVCADGNSDAETSVAKNLSDIAEEAKTLSLSLPEFFEHVDKNKMWDEFLSICQLIFETKVEDKFPCFLADDLWKVTNCDNRFEKLSVEQVRLQKSVIQNSPAVLEFLEEHGNILSDVQKNVNSIVCSDVCADGNSDAETSVAKNLSDIAEE
ncbi:hypothetical protein HELRODRAFT_184640, partial [Helobdella robusta]|uniref:Uncharacterized protein n=1 Tax=Helobdella robusta TaxID=6412 RepID=T1FLN2_HELRO